jgi:hypothetical protein
MICVLCFCIIINITEANSNNYDEFNSEYSQILEGEDFRYLAYIDIPTLPIGETKRLDILRKDEYSLTYQADTSSSLEVIISGYNKALDIANEFFQAEPQIISFLKEKINDSSEASQLFGLYSRHREVIPMPEYSSTMSPTIIECYYVIKNKYSALAFSINYCLNQVFSPNDIRLIFLSKYEGLGITLNKLIDQEWQKFESLYDRYFETDLKQFYLEVTKTFGYLVDPYLESNATYTIKEPYKSMNDPDLIKIQKYFNER